MMALQMAGCGRSHEADAPPPSEPICALAAITNRKLHQSKHCFTAGCRRFNGFISGRVWLPPRNVTLPLAVITNSSSQKNGTCLATTPLCLAECSSYRVTYQFGNNVKL